MATAAAPHEAPDWGIVAEWHALIERRDPRFSPVATVGAMADPLARLEASIKVSLWNMQRHHTIRTLRNNADLDASLRRKQVDLRYILPRRVAERRFPLATSSEPELRLAPVAHPLMIADGARFLVGDFSGETVWTSADPGLVAGAMNLFEGVWRTAEPAVPEGEDPPYTRRMVEIAVLLVDGATDREIARSLSVSERTVSGDVREMSRRLGARSRSHAIALISGVEG